MKTFKGTLVGSAFAVSACGAIAQAKERIAPPAVYKVAPGLGQYTDDLLFGEVWESPDLTPRDRSLVTVTTLISTGKFAQVGSHTRRALDNGVTPEEIGEMITQLAFYTGWPNAISSVFEVEKVFDERGIDGISDATELPAELAPDADAEAARRRSVDTSISPVLPRLSHYTNEALFSDLWLRPQLSPRDRSLVTIVSLVATGQAEQVRFHAQRGLDNGLSREEIAGAVTHIAFYAGWPKAVSSVSVLEDVFNIDDQADSGSVQVNRAEDNRSVTAPADNFTGQVQVDTYFSAEPPARHGGAIVHFSPGARTAWHTHPLGQTLIVTEGVGRVQSEGDAVRTIRKGDVVWIPPNSRHWHGASPDARMSHVAIAEAENGSAVTWMEHVGGEDDPSTDR